MNGPFSRVILWTKSYSAHCSQARLCPCAHRVIEMEFATSHWPMLFRPFISSHLIHCRGPVGAHCCGPYIGTPWHQDREHPAKSRWYAGYCRLWVSRRNAWRNGSAKPCWMVKPGSWARLGMVDGVVTPSQEPLDLRNVSQSILDSASIFQSLWPFYVSCLSIFCPTDPIRSQSTCNLLWFSPIPCIPSGPCIEPIQMQSSLVLPFLIFFYLIFR